MMFPDMFTAQHPSYMLMEMVVMMFRIIITTISYMLMEMVVMMFPDMFTTQFIFHVDGDGGDDVHDMFTTQFMFQHDGDGGDDVP